MGNITLTIPNDDHIALRAFGKALEEMALAHGAEPVQETLVRQRAGDVEVEYLTHNAVAAKIGVTLEELDNIVTKAEVDTTVQQVESLAVPGATHVITKQKLVGDPEPVGDGNFSQGYVATVEEIADPVDSTGTPWDERIHSASKALNADGTWRLRRKPKDMDETEWSDYINETLYEIKPATTSAGKDIDKLISEIDTAGTHGEGLGGIEPPVTPPGDDYQTDTDVVTEQTVAGIPPLPVPPPVVVAPEVTEWDFPRLMTFLTERHGKIDVATVNTLLAQDGMLSVQELNARPDKIGPFVARVKAHLGE